MERRVVRIGEIYIEELWFDNPRGAVRGGVSFMGTDLFYNPVDKSVVQGEVDGISWMFSVLDAHECMIADKVIDATIGAIAYNAKEISNG